jgi:DNA-binding response OmpR family regulator
MWYSDARPEACFDRGRNVTQHATKREILCVDDELALAELCEERLCGLGYRVTGEADVDKALRLFESRPESFDLLIVDHLMPKMSGTELAKKALAIRPDVNILLVSGYDGEVSVAEAKETGIKEVLVKPFQTAELDAAIKRVLGHEE